MTLRTFLHDRIESVEQLEILMVLRRTGQTSDTRQIAETLGLSLSGVRHHLERLTGCGLLDAKLGGDDVLYRYDPLSSELRRLVDSLAEYYAQQRSAVVSLVATRGRQSLRDFAAAFRFRNSE